MLQENITYNFIQESYMNIVIFGSGMVARKLLSYPLRKEHKILYICDNNKNVWGNDLYGNKIPPPYKRF